MQLKRDIPSKWRINSGWSIMYTITRVAVKDRIMDAREIRATHLFMCYII